MSTRGRASSTGGGAAMTRPSTHTTSPSATLVPSCAGASLTVTRPARIHSSTPRREPIPARASHFCRRSAMMFSVYGVGAGGLVDAVVIGRFVLRCDLVRCKRRRIGFCIGGDAFRLIVSRLTGGRRQRAGGLGGAERLTIGDEHQRLEQRARITRRLFFTEPRDPLRVILFHLKAKATADLLELDAARRAVLAQGLQGLLYELRLRPRLLGKHREQLFHVHGLAGGEQGRFKNILQLREVHRHDSGLVDKSVRILRSV